MKKPLLFFIIIALISFTPNTTNAQLALGDIAFTGYNSDGGDEVSFVLLRNFSIGESIAFTENGWFSAGGFRTGEQTCILTFSGNYNCGSQIFISATPFGARDESGASAGVLSGSAMLLATAGDQVFAFDPANIPVAGDESGFVAAIQMNGAWDADATSANTSAKPSVFTDGVNSISISPEVDNAQYNCSVTAGDPSTVLAPAIWNATNWNTDDITPYTAPAPCTITCSAVPCNNPSPALLSLNPMTVCDGDSGTLFIQGVLNDATHWAIYSGSCGGTLLGTTSGVSFMVQINMPNTDFFVRGEGGCVVPGVCNQISGIGLPIDDPTFSYPMSTYCTTDGLQTPTTTMPLGTFSSSPAGLDLTPTLGLLNPSTSTPNTYTVYYTTNGVCPAVDSTTIVIGVCTGVDVNQVANEMSIYPNPTNGLFMVNINDFNNATLTVIDVLGKAVLNQNITSASTPVNLTGYNKGVYFVKVESNNGNTIKKIVIE